MWKYKTLIFIATGTIVMVLLIDLMRIFNIYPDAVTVKAIEIINVIGQIFCIYILIVVLKKHHETFWRILPFYMLIGIKLMAYYVVPLITTAIAETTFAVPGDKTYIMLMGFVGLSFGAMYIYLIISCFKVKNTAISANFKLYAWCTMGAAVALSAIRGVRVMPYGSWYSILVQDMIPLLPVLATIWMLYKLYDRQENYIPGDIIITIHELDNVPIGTNGTIIKSHGSDFYDVEFLDDNGTLLNELSISSDEFMRVELPDLQARVDNFGQA